MTRTGWDVSSYQGNLPSSGIPGDFLFVKATEGSSYKNPYAPQQVGAGKSNGLLVGYYHFLTTEPISDQITNFYAMASNLGETRLPLALDTEVQWSSWQALANAMVAFAQHVESWTNIMLSPHTLFYVNKNFYDNLVPQGFPWGRWVWLADPSGSAPADSCQIWQQAPRPESWDANNNVDPDTFMGSDQDWANFTGATAPSPPTAPTQEDALMEAVTAPDGTRQDVVYVNPDGSVQHAWAADGSHFAGSENIGGVAKSVSATWSLGRFRVYAHGTDDHVYVKTSDGSNWIQDWTQLNMVMAP